MRAKVGAKPYLSGGQVDDTLISVHSYEEKRNAPLATWFICSKCEQAYQRKDVVEIDGILLCAFQCGGGFLPHGDYWSEYRDMYMGLDFPETPTYGSYYGF